MAQPTVNPSAMHPVHLVASASLFRTAEAERWFRCLNRQSSSSPAIDPPPCGRHVAVFSRSCPLRAPAADVFPTGSSATLRLGSRELGVISPCFLISFCRIEEVCGRVQTYISGSGFGPRITTAGRDGKTHRGADRKRHVVLLLHFGGGIKGCGDILVLAVRRRCGTTLPALHLALDRLAVVLSIVLPAGGFTDLPASPRSLS